MITIQLIVMILIMLIASIIELSILLWQMLMSPQFCLSLLILELKKEKHTDPLGFSMNHFELFTIDSYI